MFKVVCTEENGEKLISAVPSSWESNNILRWPRNKLILKKIRKVANSMPGEDWFSFKCSVKSSNINTFAEASIIEKSLAAFSDTESESRQTQRKNWVTDTGRNFDNLFDDIGDVGPSTESTIFQNNCVPETVDSYVQNGKHVELDTFNNPSSVNESVPKDLIENHLQGNIAPETLEIDLCVVNRIPLLEKEVSGLHVKLDNIISTLNELKTSVSRKPRISEEYTDEEEENIFPVIDVEQIFVFEQRLQNTEFCRKMKSFLSRIVGKNNIPGGGINAAYKLIDAMFSRSVLTNFTWTGNTTADDNKNKKTAFVSLKNVIKLFNDVVFEADRTFSSIDNENFFKNRILKYAKTRATVNVDQTKLRCSSKRSVHTRSRRCNTRDADAATND